LARKTTELAGAALGGGMPGGEVTDQVEAARSELFTRILTRVHRYFCRLAGSEAEELTQETLLVLHRSLSEATYRPGHSFNSWTFLKAHRVFVDYCRRREREAKRQAPPAGESVDPGEVVEARLDAAAFLEVLRERLGAEVQEAFVLRYESGLSLDEVAEAMDCARRTVSRRLERAHALFDELRAGGEA
jgi:RNA polymerase sigma-70 factor, ECF subfamily